MDTPIIIFGDNIPLLKVINTMISESFPNTTIATDIPHAATHIPQNSSCVLLLCFKDADTAEKQYLQLYQQTNGMIKTAQKTILLCKQHESEHAYAMCREFIFDDYLVASPLHDEFRLRFCVSQAIRLLSIEEKVKETAELSTSWLNDNESNLFANDETEQTTPSQNPLSTRLNQLENNLNSDIKHYSEELKTSKYEKMLSIKDAKSFTPTFNSRLQEIIHNRISTTETEMTNDKRIFFNEYLKNQELRKPALSLLGNEKYIMVIDDNPVSSAELNHFFNEQQFTTYYSTNGKAALSKMLENMPSLIFINNEISGMQSNAIVKMGNILHKDKMPPTIVFTSKATRQNLADIMNQGATSVVSRPFNFDKLLTKITAALSS